MKLTRILAIAAVAAIAVLTPADLSAKKKAKEPAPAPVEQPADTADYSLERAMGTFLGTAMERSMNQISSLGVKFDRAQLISTVIDVLDGKSTGFTFEEADVYIGRYIDSLRAEANKPLSMESQTAFLQSAAAEEGATVTPSGLVFKIITEGEGAMPTDSDSVRLLYTGSLSNGDIFDSTEEPVVFTVSNLVEGFTEGLKMMRPGGIYEITIPADLGYGPQGIPGAIPGNAALKFVINLLEVIP